MKGKSLSGVWPHGLQPTRLRSPWDFPGKSTGVGCHCLLRVVLTARNLRTSSSFICSTSSGLCIINLPFKLWWEHRTTPSWVGWKVLFCQVYFICQRKRVILLKFIFWGSDLKGNKQYFSDKLVSKNLISLEII